MSTTQQHSNIPNTAVKFAPGLCRTNLQRYDLSVPGREMIQSRVDIEVYNAGEALTVPAGVIHAVRNAGTGTGTGTELATYVVEKGKPLLTVAQ